MAQPPAAHLGHRAPAGRHQGRQHQGGGIPHPAGGMLIQLDAWQIAQIHHLAGMPHGFRQGGGLPRGHALEAYGHHPSGHLVIWDLPLGEPLDDMLDLFFCMGFPSAFFLDQIHHAHIVSLPILGFPAAPYARRFAAHIRSSGSVSYIVPHAPIPFKALHVWDAAPLETLSI